VDDPLLVMFVALKSIVSDTSWHCRSGVTSCPESKYKQLYLLDVYHKMSPGDNIIYIHLSLIYPMEPLAFLEASTETLFNVVWY